jgi:hypothetical protein
MAKIFGAKCVFLYCLLQWACVGAADLVTADKLQRWHVEKAQGGPTFSGSPAWQSHMTFIEDALRDRGVVDLTREEINYRRWFASDDPGASDRGLTIDGQKVAVASYWAYSGSTDADGVTAPLVYYQRNMPAEAMRGRIVVFDVSMVPGSMQSAFKSGYEYANYDTAVNKDGIASDQWFQGNFVIRFGKFDVILKEAKAAGAIVIFDMSPDRAAGLYTFPLLRPGIFGVPGLYVDRVAGATVREAAKKEATATLTLEAREEDASTYFLFGALPGRNYGTPEDEMLLLVTHSEGPNLTQENGTLGIVSIIDYFAQLPQIERNRTLFVLFDPQHYMPGRHLVHWYDDHPEIVSRIVASIGVEQLGQREYSEEGDEYGLNGLPEPTLIFSQDNDRLVEIAIEAVKEHEVPRTEVRVPSREGQGMWQGLGDFAIKQNVPGYAISSAMSGYWTTTAGLESFDKGLCYKQIGVLVALTDALMNVDLDAISVPFVDPAANPAMSPGVDR